MNAPIPAANHDSDRELLTASEVSAHLVISDTLTALSRSEIGDRTALHIMWRPIETFAPRCNCGKRLKFGPWKKTEDTMARLVACACGVCYFEARL